MEPRLTATAPRYCGHFILARSKAQSVIFLFKESLKNGQPVNMARFLWSVGNRINEVPLYYYQFVRSFLLQNSTYSRVFSLSIYPQIWCQFYRNVMYRKLKCNLIIHNTGTALACFVTYLDQIVNRKLWVILLRSTDDLHVENIVWHRIYMHGFCTTERLQVLLFTVDAGPSQV